MDNHSGRNPNPRGVGNRKDFKDHTKLCAANKNYNKCSAVAEMGDRLATTNTGRKLGACAPFLGMGSWVPILHNVAWAEAYLHTKWHLDSFSHLGTTDMGRKLEGLCPLFWGGEMGPHLAQCGLPPYQVASWSIEPHGHNRYGPKIRGGLCPFRRGGPGFSSNTVWPVPRSTCMPSGILIHAAVWPQ